MECSYNVLIHLLGLISLMIYASVQVGNGAFAQLYDKIVPNSFRVVVDGDLVTALPPSRVYRHIGVCVVIDSTGAGSIIIDPSFVEVWLRIQSKSSVANHSLLMYKKGKMIPHRESFPRPFLRSTYDMTLLDYVGIVAAASL